MINVPLLLKLLCVMTLLLGCEPSKSEQTHWNIKQGALLLGSDKVDWQQTKPPICKPCLIKHDSGFHPGGPSHTTRLFENNQWRASKVDEFRNWITIWQDKKPTKLFVVPLSEQQLSLELPDGAVTVNIQSKLSFSYQGNDYQLWIESFSTPTVTKDFSNERDADHINYLLLSL